MGEPTRVLIGTTKGAFILNSDETGAVQSLQGPLCDGWPINHMIGDPETGDLWAAGGGEWQGAGVWRSRDGGDTWTLSKLANGQADEWLAASPELAEQLGMTPAPPAPFSGEVVNLWSLGRTGETLYAGAKPAALFASQDRGETWNRVQGLSDHPSSDGWEPGAAGLTLHTILSDPGDPAKLWIGISAAGVFASEDGGATWDRRNRLSNAVPPDTHSHPAAPCGNQTGLCVHNLALSPGDRLYQQNHHGTYRSRDGGRTWDDITAGLPSTFGFPVAVHPEDPDTLWVLPLNGDSAGRFPPDASAAIWRSSDGGDTWARCGNGLPQQDCFFTVLRQGMVADPANPGAVYFGTNTGSVFATKDSGDSWREIARHLPAILCVETVSAA